MAAEVSSRDAFCTFTFLDCFSKKEESRTAIDQQFSHIKRETRVQDQQPHLVEPMKLTVYEDLPCTPLSAHHDITTPRPFFSRAMTASRASSRASLFSLKKMVSRHSLSISSSTPAPVLLHDEVKHDLPLRRRRREFRPLELSIYIDSKRLSDLPEFNRFSFTEFGELKNLSQALSRPQSAVLPPRRVTDLPDVDGDCKPTSMYEVSSLKTSRPQTSYSVKSMSRPPSEYDALHSHPVSWSTLPGLSISTQHMKQDRRRTVLAPMQEEISPEPATVFVGGTVLKFPQRQSSFFAVADAQLPAVDLAAPAPVVSRMSHHSRSQSRSLDDLRHSPIRSRHMHKRSISQWLVSRARARSTSTSTISSISTTRSFKEHHRKRSQFYQLGNQVAVTAPNTISTQQQPQSGENEILSDNDSTYFMNEFIEKDTTAMTFEDQYQNEIHDDAHDDDRVYNLNESDSNSNHDNFPHHQRTITGSTVASTIDTAILTDATYSTTRTSSDNDNEAGCLRSNTIKSVSSPGGRRPITSVVNHLGLVAPMRGQVYIVNNDSDDDDDDIDRYEKTYIDNNEMSSDKDHTGGALKAFGIRSVIDPAKTHGDVHGTSRPTVVGVAF